MTRGQNNRKLLYALLALLLLVITVISGRSISSASAAISGYTGVIEDLRMDGAFDVDDYPSNYQDTSIQVIQVAESTDGELFIYTYQPCQKTIYLVASQVNMSLTESVDNTKLYDLTLCDIDGVFGKYVVKNFTVSKAITRYYNISTIYRPYDKLADDASLKNNKSIGFEVGWCWTAISANNTVYYTKEKVDVITITDCAYGTVRVPAGYNLWSSYASDIHIIAFSTDIKMDKLLEADVAFDYRSVDVGMYDHPDYGKWYSEYVTVTYKEKGSTIDHLFGPSSRTWDKIQTSSEFLDTMDDWDIDLEDEMRDGIKKTEWVLCFWQTAYENDMGGTFGSLTFLDKIFGVNYKHFTQVSNATVIRLEFIKDGVAYNLGVVSNSTGDFQKVGGDDYTFNDAVKDFFDDIKIGIGNFFKNIPWWVYLIIALLVFGVLFPVLSVVFPVFGAVLKKILSTIWKGIKWIAVHLWGLICAPFRGIKALIDKRRKNE